MKKCWICRRTPAEVVKDCPYKTKIDDITFAITTINSVPVCLVCQSIIEEITTENIVDKLKGERQ